MRPAPSPSSPATPVAEPARASWREAPFRPVDFLSVDLAIDTRADGTLILRSRHALAKHERVIPRLLAARAAAQGDKPFLKRRAGPDRAWAALTYAEAKARSDAVAQWLIDRGVARDRSVLILSGNSLDHMVVKLGAFAAGVPVCPVSVNYGLAGADFGRLAHVVDLVKPAVVFVEEAAPFARALAQVDFGDAVILTREGAGAGRATVALDVALAARPVAVDARIAAAQPDDVAALMLTSGSTGRPKAVIQTHGMIAANLAQAIQTMGQAAGWDGDWLDWLPWNHVSGATAPFLALAAGGTLHIDDGRPIAGAFEESLRNLREIGARYYVNVPLGYAMLADALEADADLRERFFRDLRVMLYGGAGLPQPVLDRLQAMAVATTGHRILGSSAYGATETTSGFMTIHYETDRVGIGLPMPGVEVKLVPHGQRHELRVRGPITMPGYLGAPEKNAEVFDDEGFYSLGDYATFIDPGDPAKGLAFAGRLAEEFKLASGTWVRGGALKADLIRHLAPLVADLVICGDGGACVGVMVWLSPAAAAQEASEPGHARAALAERLKAHNQAFPGQSTRIARCLVLSEPPQVEAHEISDKGTINRNAVIERRAADHARLFADPPDPAVIAL